jgi:hypothetical protein
MHAKDFIILIETGQAFNALCDGGGWWRAWLCECVCVCRVLSGVGSASFSLCGSKELHVEMDVDM